MSFLIEANQLYKSFNGFTAVAGLNLQVNSGEIYGLVGPDGAGKTTTMRLLCGAYRPDFDRQEGKPSILIDGLDIFSQTEQARCKIGYLPQRFSLYEELTVIENLRFFAEVRGISPDLWLPRCMEILGFVGLQDFTGFRAGNLSGGMKQKLGLAAAMVHHPQVLLLDEPTTGVDPVTRQDFWQLIIRLVSQNGNLGKETALLVSTPYMDEASRCTRIGFMVDGELVQEGTPAQLRASLAGQILEVVGSPLPLLRRTIVRDEDVLDVQTYGDRLHLKVNPGTGEKVIARLESQLADQEVTVVRLRVITPMLEDVFMSYVIQRD